MTASGRPLIARWIARPPGQVFSTACQAAWPKPTTLDEHVIASLRVMDGELRAYEFCDERQVKERLRPYVWRG